MKILITEQQLRLLTEQKSIFIPRRMEDRKERHKDVIYKQIQDYIKNGSKGSLDLSETPIESLPDNLRVGGSLNLENCTYLTSLPNNLNVGRGLDLSYCTSLTSLPDNLNVGGSLYLNYCTSLTSLPNNLNVEKDLYLINTPLAEKYTEYEIMKMIEDKGGSVDGYIFI